MSLLKYIDRMGKRAMGGSRIMDRSTNNWEKFKAAYERKMLQRAGGLHTLTAMTIRERNGSRGEGLGMGHRNRQNRTK